MASRYALLFVLASVSIAVAADEGIYDFPFAIYSLRPSKKSGLSMFVPMGLTLQKGGKVLFILHIVIKETTC
jgi:hypothetical protein